MPPSQISARRGCISAVSQTQVDSSTIDGLRAIYDEREGECEGDCCCEILHVDAVALFRRRSILLRRSGFIPLKAGNDGLRAISYLHLLKASTAPVDFRVRTTPSLSSHLICPLAFVLLQTQLANTWTSPTLLEW